MLRDQESPDGDIEQLGLVYEVSLFNNAFSDFLVGSFLTEHFYFRTHMLDVHQLRFKLGNQSART